MDSSDHDEFDVELDGFPEEDHSSRSDGGDPLERLATQYVSQVRRGENPGQEGWEHLDPEMAGELADLLSTAAALEQWKTQKEVECLRQNRPEQFEIERLGDCEIIREIGRGGMGVVFEALQGRLERQVAVKVLPWRFGEALPHWRDRFQQEAKTIAKLRHPNIVPIFTFGESEGYCYYVMQFVKGLSLDRALLRGDEPQPARHPVAQKIMASHWLTIAKVGVQVASALAYAHGMGILHHDIKPANLLLDSGGKILVTDFCGNRLQDELQNDQQRGTGTFRYLAPERLQLPGDDRSDVYSLGVTLYELATQQPAFASDARSDLIEKITRAEFTAPRKINRNLPWSLEAIILKAMAADPNERYPSAQAMRMDLLRFVNDQPISLPKPSLYQRAKLRYLHWRGR